MVQTHRTRTAPGSERNKARYALIAVPLVAVGLVIWYLAATFLVAPTIDGPAADSVQGVAVTTGDDLVIDGDTVAPNAAGEGATE